ncbi:GntR family transcriptional regulator [Marinomonas posidonica]|uniref:Transcriptional regulator, GntR family n=1 Tax=Marinomonas posidonica (strain CECT 7376 / NCIMB 14433 / IVIA-Po-181) TaxID=491952 RepID=F6D090_MARPP|nr:GntR family transcriptional regulator [Marinomonas posidonica]AEF55914.1 transcriptional regulator, GntR family [Marinomonas posidonica IVIA-Po-181]
MSQIIPIKSATLSEDIAQHLINAIVAGDIEQGSKISEPELAKQYGISRGPLREAIVKLEGLGLVTRTANVGARVIELNTRDMLDTFAMREALEGMAARLAASNMAQAEVNDLYQLLDKHQAFLDANQDEHYAQQGGNEDFHLRIIQASGNGKLIRLLSHELYAVIRMYRRHTADQRSDPRQALREHKAILDAIANQEGDLAELLMRRHISRASRLLQQAMEQSDHSQSVKK